MDETSAGHEMVELGYGGWIAFWAQLIVLGLFVVLGAFFASRDSAPGDYACGLTLSLAAIGLALMRVKNRFDGGATDCAGFLLVADWANLIAVIVVFSILGLGGLVVAAGVEYGGLHDGGVALFVASALAVFFSLKHVFDMIERGH